jgi:hypothetical protein
MTITRQGRGVCVALLVALAVPATAFADPPTATTNAASGVGQDAATLHGTVNPKGNNSVVAFQYGTSKIYGTNTPATGVGAGKNAVKVAAPIGALAPNTTYHFRVVVQYSNGNKNVFGNDRTFKTKKQPLGVSLVASDNRVKAGTTIQLNGQVTGTDYEGQQVVLQTNPYPFAGFANTGNPQVILHEGTFSFPVIVSVNTSYRVVLPDHPEVVSPIVSVEVPVQVFLKVGKRVKKGHRLMFRGRITPVNENAPVDIQREFHHTWVTVAHTQVSDSGAGSSFFHKKVRVRRSGRYRALVTPGAAYAANHSRVHRVRIKH